MRVPFWNSHFMGEHMISGNFYFLTDEYCEKYKTYGIMENKETEDDEPHNRPCFYAVPDEDNENIFWMIPISSNISKYRDILNKKLRRYKDYDGLEFGYVMGREAAFLLQNICPVTLEYIVEEYIDFNSGDPVSIPSDLKRKLNQKARKIIRLAKKGTKISLTDVVSILNDLRE